MWPWRWDKKNAIPILPTICNLKCNIIHNKIKQLPIQSNPIHKYLIYREWIPLREITSGKTGNKILSFASLNLGTCQSNDSTHLLVRLDKSFIPSRFLPRASFRDQPYQTPARSRALGGSSFICRNHAFSRMLAPTEAEISNRIERVGRKLLLYWFLIENGSPHERLEMISTSTAISFRYHHHRQHSFQPRVNPPQQIQKTSDLPRSTFTTQNINYSTDTSRRRRIRMDVHLFLDKGMLKPMLNKLEQSLKSAFPLDNITSSEIDIDRIGQDFHCWEKTRGQMNGDCLLQVWFHSLWLSIISSCK